MQKLKEVKQKLNKSILATIGQNKCCDSLPTLNKVFDILIKETTKMVCDRMMGKEIKNPNFVESIQGYNTRIEEEKELKKQIIKELK